jgi:hypothetical protein
MNNTTFIPKKQDDIFVFNFGDFATFLYKDRELWLRFEDVAYVLTEAQKEFLISSGAGLCERMQDKSIDGVYVQFDSFIACASSEAKPLLRVIKRKILGMVAQEDGR